MAEAIAVCKSHARGIIVAIWGFRSFPEELRLAALYEEHVPACVAPFHDDIPHMIKLELQALQNVEFETPRHFYFFSASRRQG